MDQPALLVEVGACWTISSSSVLQPALLQLVVAAVLGAAQARPEPEPAYKPKCRTEYRTQYTTVYETTYKVTIPTLNWIVRSWPGSLVTLGRESH